MTRVERRETTRIRHEYIVPAPGVIGDVQDAIAMAAAESKEKYGVHPSSDDWLAVTSDDEHIIFYWEEVSQ